MFTRAKPQPALPQSPEALAKETPQPTIDDLSFVELKAFHQHVGEVLAQKEAQARLDFRRDFIERMGALGLTIDDLKPEKPKKERKKRDVKAKYRSPETGEEWSGRGRAPMWMQLFLEQGRQLDEFLIDGAPAEPAGPS